MFGTGHDDAAISNIVARFLSTERQSELIDVVNIGKGCLSAFTNSLAATNILAVGDNVGSATSVEKKWAVANILVPPVDRTKKL